MGRLFGLFLIATLLPACAPRLAQVSQTLTQKSAGTVAVLPFQGPQGDVFAGRVGYELLRNGASVVARDRVAALLQERALQTTRFGPNAPLARVLALGKALKADTVVVGSVESPGPGNSVLDKLRGFSGEPVTAAAIRFVRVADGSTVSYASYRPERDVPLLRDDSHKVARKLIEAVFANGP